MTDNAKRARLNETPVVVLVVRDGALFDVVRDRPVRVVWARCDAPQAERVYEPANTPNLERCMALLLGLPFEDVYPAHVRGYSGRPELRLVGGPDPEAA